MASTARHRFTRKRFGALGIALAALAAGGFYAVDARSGQAHAATNGSCSSFASLETGGKYWLNNNTWGASSGSGWSCLWSSYTSGDTVGWGTNYDWSGSPYSVKSYASAVLGWHWGSKESGTGLPVQLATKTAVTTHWQYQVTESTSGVYDVAYDLWLHGIADPTYSSTPKDEVMVWLGRGGGAGPLGSKTATVSLGGDTWDLYEGSTSGWPVYSFVRVGNTTDAMYNLQDFLQELVGRGLLSETDYLSGVEAGTEVFTGKAQLDTQAYSTTVG